MMPQQCAELLRSLDLLGATQVELARIVARRDAQRRHDLIAQRRMLVSQTRSVTALGTAMFSELDDPVLLSEFERLVSAARSKAAFHQADWSAVRVGESDAEYGMSARQAGEAHLLLSRWLRRTVADIAGR